MTEALAPRRALVGDVAGAFADLGVFVPLVAALVLVNGLDGGTVLLVGGALVIATGVLFRIPFPVQPLKALTAVAVAQQLGADVIHAAGLLIGLFLLVLSVRRLADVVARVFTQVVVRALQVGVGALLVLTSVRLVTDTPAVFAATPPAPWPWLLAAGAFGIVVWSAARRRYVVALAVVLGGALLGALLTGLDVPVPALGIPSLAAPPIAAFPVALTLLVIPQLPLTFGNAVVAVNDVAHEYFGPRARRVSPSSVCRSAGAANIVAAFLGGIPMCHGSSGLTAHYRLGARTWRMNLMLGGAFVVLGLWFAPDVLRVLGLLPAWGLAAFLAYAGVRHVLLVGDQRGIRLAVALVAGLVGAATGNLAITTVVALVADHGLSLAARRRTRAGALASDYSSSPPRGSSDSPPGSSIVASGSPELTT